MPKIWIQEVIKHLKYTAITSKRQNNKQQITEFKYAGIK